MNEWEINVLDTRHWCLRMICYAKGASLVVQTVKNLPATQETQVWSLGQEDDPLEKGMATHSSILAWRIPWTVEPGGLQSMGSQRVRHDWVTNTHTHTQHHRKNWIMTSYNFLSYFCLSICFYFFPSKFTSDGYPSVRSSQHNWGKLFALFSVPPCDFVHIFVLLLME